MKRTETNTSGNLKNKARLTGQRLSNSLTISQRSSLPKNDDVVRIDHAQACQNLDLAATLDEMSGPCFISRKAIVTRAGKELRGGMHRYCGAGLSGRCVTFGTGDFVAVAPTTRDLTDVDG